MTMTIRAAERDDLPRLLDIYNEAILHSAATFDLVPQSLDEREPWFRQFGERYPIIVAVQEDGSIAGYCCLTPFRAKAAYDRTAELSVYLDKSCRGQGIGTALLRHIIDIARQRRFHVIIAAITGGNETSIALHRKFGFEPAGIFREVGFKFDAWQDVHFLQLLLHDSQNENL
ncbi:N-acetyltransferase family protein [Paenibacillus hodogayensis]|uniref:N-acetyltransferase family protein n=1 Tax=Paenibacillus hodogayensis TaxID=279208 RepID=A0ABV5VPD7_9BACL